MSAKGERGGYRLQHFVTWSLCTEGPRSPSPAGAADQEVGAKALGQGAEPRSPASGDVTGPVGEAAGGLAFSASRGSVAALGVSFPCCSEVPGRAETWAGRGRGRGRWREGGASLRPALDALQWQGRRLVRGAGHRGSSSRPRPHLGPAPQLGPHSSGSL